MLQIFRHFLKAKASTDWKWKSNDNALNLIKFKVYKIKRNMTDWIIILIERALFLKLIIK